MTPRTRFTLPYRLQYGPCAQCSVHDAEYRPTVNYSVAQILSYSSNVGAVTIARKLGPERLQSWVKRFGFGSLTGIDFPGESAGYVLPLDRVERDDDRQRADRPGNLGHADPDGLGVRGGRERRGLDPAASRRPGRRPRARDVEAPPADVGRRSTARSRRCSAASSTIPARPATRRRSRATRSPGKTGTGQVATAHGYSSTDYTASFVGMVPASHPRLVVLVKVDDPRGSIFGGVVAAPGVRGDREVRPPVSRGAAGRPEDARRDEPVCDRSEPGSTSGRRVSDALTIEALAPGALGRGRADLRGGDRDRQCHVRDRGAVLGGLGRLSSRSGTGSLPWTDGEVVGWAALSPVSSRCVYEGVAEESVYVAEQARGRGVGRALLEALIARAEAAGIWTIQTSIFPENTASLELHRRVGLPRRRHEGADRPPSRGLARHGVPRASKRRAFRVALGAVRPCRLQPALALSVRPAVGSRAGPPGVDRLGAR